MKPQTNRRSFLKKSIAGITALSLGPYIEDLSAKGFEVPASAKKAKLRFALASDGHYGQPETDFKTSHTNLIKWLNEEHAKTPLDFVIINGDLVHDRPELLKELKETYFDKLPCPFYALPGNHDHADTALWKSIFGYEDNYSLEFGNCGIVLANTSNVKGEFVCPDNAFLKKELDKFSTKKTVFVVLHIPPHLWVPEQTFFAECPDTLNLLHQFPNIKAVFHGHEHSLDSVLYTKKLPHFFDGHYGGNWGTEYKGYRIVEIDEQDKISTFQVNASKDPVINRAAL